MEESEFITGKEIEAEVALLCEKLNVVPPPIRFTEEKLFLMRPAAAWIENELRISLSVCQSLDRGVLRHILAVALINGDPRKQSKRLTSMVLAMLPSFIFGFSAYGFRRDLDGFVIVILWLLFFLSFLGYMKVATALFRRNYLQANIQAMDITGDLNAAIGAIERSRELARQRKKTIFSRSDDERRLAMIATLRDEAKALRLAERPVTLREYALESEGREADKAPLT